MVERTNMLIALFLPDIPMLNGNNYHMLIDKKKFLLTQLGIYSLTVEEACKASKRSYGKDTRTFCGYFCITCLRINNKMQNAMII